jgi:hypothetical protein
MNANEAIPSSRPPRREPRNEGRLIGAKPPLRASHVWSIWPKLQLAKAPTISRYSIWPSTANCVAAIVAMRVDDVAPNATRSIEQRSARN